MHVHVLRDTRNNDRLSHFYVHVYTCKSKRFSVTRGDRSKTLKCKRLMRDRSNSTCILEQGVVTYYLNGWTLPTTCSVHLHRYALQIRYTIYLIIMTSKQKQSYSEMKKKWKYFLSCRKGERAYWRLHNPHF